MGNSLIWHQIATKFICKDKNSKEIEQLNVFERREGDSSVKDWRICHIE